MNDDANRIKVVVRVRPPLPREQAEGGSACKSKSLVQISSEEVATAHLHHPTNQTKKTFHFDDCFSSFDKSELSYTDNGSFYARNGPELMTHFFGGYNVCFLAYGQTSSGKTFSMMGEKQHPGMIPLLMHDIFKQMEVLIGQKISCELKISYIEIYNEQVRDLLRDSEIKCRIREHPQTGPYVENVKEYSVTSYNQFVKLLNLGNGMRTTASTSMNDKSSRSHAVITLTLKQTKFERACSTTTTNGADYNDDDEFGDASEETISNIKLVDLAGSERMKKTNVYSQQERVKEGALINKSLTVLGRCINLLATKSTLVVPYRDSILTYLLKENLGGNSKTCMLFCVSPFDYEETHQTLSYANEVKKISTSAKANRTKLKTAPINWEELRADDTVVGTLRSEIDRLAGELTKLKVENVPSQDSKQDAKVSNLLEYLERRSAKLEFENKYLKSSLSIKDKHIVELTKHVDYLHRDYQSLYASYRENQMKQLQQARVQLLGEIAQCCESMDKDLERFDPSQF
ncbi:uncharacterized protein LODBEIA_P28090 [Lodderomyces beijingensis]|uniref:Kinesin motor domain-containing protein n=1 Tax=Lodderomyces beijingensis TaxID=1775926 RepID=A0ABP0ZMZ5_9ASCO